jgi:large subunit ribosomal protein L28
MIGRNIRHKASGSWERKAHKTSRTFKANVRPATVMLQGAPTRVRICTRCLRTLSKT